jgi:hypothetical protein
MADTDEAKLELRILKHLLQPSYLSATIAVLTTLIAIGSGVVSRLYLSTGWLADVLRTVTNSDQQVFSSSTSDGGSPLNAVLLFVFWSCVGLSVYFLVIGLVQAVREVRQLEQEMTFVHTNRRIILQTFFFRLITRVAGLVLVFVTAAIYLKTILPYGLTAVAAVELSFGGILTIVLATSISLVTIHLLAVLLRIVALRPRLFTAEIEA